MEGERIGGSFIHPRPNEKTLFGGFESEEFPIRRGYCLFGTSVTLAIM